ncbi:MAG TPA: peptidylprolyl isomerase [Candidatus Acidoferrales bacterium]|nr:peptidylprolyl isomerase [Candidatus Acidoferrales bacterium]
MKLLKEPLLHFLAAGALLFAAYGWLHPGGDATRADSAHQVRISASDVQWLSETWTRQWQREPSRDELNGLVAEFLKEELLSREARAMRLDENDTIVRRRLAQKVEFLVQDTARLAQPSEDDLRRFYAANPQRFTDESRISFSQIYFSREQRKDAAGEARAALSRLSRSDAPPASTLGDRIMIDGEFHDADEQTVAAQFGKSFADTVFTLVPGEWHGPIESGYGLHLVRVSQVTPSRRLEFSEVRARVLEGWQDQQQRDTNQKYFAGLLKKYDVVVDEDVRQMIGPLAFAAGDRP